MYVRAGSEVITSPTDVYASAGDAGARRMEGGCYIEHSRVPWKSKRGSVTTISTTESGLVKAAHARVDGRSLALVLAGMEQGVGRCSLACANTAAPNTAGEKGATGVDDDTHLGTRELLHDKVLDSKATPY